MVTVESKFETSRSVGCQVWRWDVEGVKDGLHRYGVAVAKSALRVGGANEP